LSPIGAIYPASLLGNFRVRPTRTKWWSDDRHWRRKTPLHYYYLTRRATRLLCHRFADPKWQGGVSPMPAEIEEIVECYKGFHPEV